MSSANGREVQPFFFSIGSYLCVITFINHMKKCTSFFSSKAECAQVAGIEAKCVHEQSKYCTA